MKHFSLLLACGFTVISPVSYAPAAAEPPRARATAPEWRGFTDEFRQTVDQMEQAYIALGRSVKNARTGEQVAHCINSYTDAFLIFKSHVRTLPGKYPKLAKRTDLPEELLKIEQQMRNKAATQWKVPLAALKKAVDRHNADPAVLKAHQRLIEAIH